MCIIVIYIAQTQMVLVGIVHIKDRMQEHHLVIVAHVQHIVIVPLSHQDLTIIALLTVQKRHVGIVIIKVHIINHHLEELLYVQLIVVIEM
jgi:hypothetical protein